MIDHPHNCTTTKAHRQAVLRVEQPPVQEPHPERVEGRQRRGALKGVGAVLVCSVRRVEGHGDAMPCPALNNRRIGRWISYTYIPVEAHVHVQSLNETRQQLQQLSNVPPLISGPHGSSRGRSPCRCGCALLALGFELQRAVC